MMHAMASVAQRRVAPPSSTVSMEHGDQCSEYVYSLRAVILDQNSVLGCDRINTTCNPKMRVPATSAAVVFRRATVGWRLRGYQRGQLLLAQVGLVVEARLQSGVDGSFEGIDVGLHDSHTERLANLGCTGR